MGLGERPSKNSEILGVHKDRPPAYGTVAGDHPIPVIDFLVHPKIGGPMGYQGSHFLKGTFVQKVIDPFASGQFLFLMLFLDPFFPASLMGQGQFFLKRLYFGVHRFQFFGNRTFFLSSMYLYRVIRAAISASSSSSWDISWGRWCSRTKWVSKFPETKASWEKTKLPNSR